MFQFGGNIIIRKQKSNAKDVIQHFGNASAFAAQGGWNATKSPQ
jgi:hypothetical protein